MLVGGDTISREAFRGYLSELYKNIQEDPTFNMKTWEYDKKYNRYGKIQITHTILSEIIGYAKKLPEYKTQNNIKTSQINILS